jgi:homoaconitase/3-isopropylmalate dehydratase large subunit
VATADHNVPTLNQHLPIREELSRKQVETLKENCEKFGIELYGLVTLIRVLFISSGLSWVLRNLA